VQAFDSLDISQQPLVFALEMAVLQQGLDARRQLELVDGLVRKSLAPALTAFSMSPISASAVIMMMAMSRVRGFALSRSQISLPADFGHHDVEQDEIGLKAGDGIERLLTVVDHLDLIPLSREIGVEELAVLMVIVGDQDLGSDFSFFASHASNSACSCPRGAGLGKTIYGQ